MHHPELTPIIIEAWVNAPLNKVWEYWTLPAHVMRWNNASPDWHTPKAENDLRPGGSFCYTMAARDGSFQFDFSGTYDEVKEGERIDYTLDDKRKVSVRFSGDGSRIRITEIFDPESQNPHELQRQGWQAILDNFKRYVEKAG